MYDKILFDSRWGTKQDLLFTFLPRKKIISKERFEWNVVKEGTL